MKSILKKLPVYTIGIISMCVAFGALFLFGIIGLFSLIDAISSQETRGSDFLLTGVLLFGVIFSSSFVGFEVARRRFEGRPICLPSLVRPGTIIPQKQVLFHYWGARDLDGTWVIATLERVLNENKVTDLPREVRRKDLFCVWTRREFLPKKPCLLRMTFDQNRKMGLTEIPGKTLSRN